MPERFSAVLANRIHELEAECVRLRKRARELERSRDFWRLRAKSKRATKAAA